MRDWTTTDGIMTDRKLTDRFLSVTIKHYGLGISASKAMQQVAGGFSRL